MDEVRIEADALARFGSRARTGLARVEQDIDDALTLYAQRLRIHAEGRFSREFSPSASRRRAFLQNRSGAGRRSFVFDVQDQRMQFATTQPYVAVQEFGATIRPRNARYLTIPIDENLNPSGEPYETATEAIALGAFFFRSDTDELFIARASEAGDLDFLFWLTEGPVEVPPRLGIGDYVERKETQDQLLRDVTSAITTVVAEVLG